MSGTSPHSPASTSAAQYPTRTVGIIKNHALKHRHTIERRLIDAGLDIVKERQMEFSADADREVLEELFGNDAAALSEAPVWVYVLERHRAIETLQSLMGSENPEEARRNEPHSIRAIYGIDSINNAFGGSVDSAAAEAQIAALFASSPPFPTSDLPSEGDVDRVSIMENYGNFLQNHILDNKWSKDHESILLEPYTYMTSQPGKDFRTKLTAAFNDWLRVPEEQLTLIGKIVQMLHNASLLMDDVEDDAQMRRGIPVAHKIYGIPQTINTANYVYFLAYKELFALRDQSDPNERLDEIVNEEFLNLHRGQGLEMYWRDSLQCPTEQEYLGMVSNKTGGLLRLAVKLMMVKSNSNVDYVPLVNLIGVYFQIRDDYMNLQSDQYATNKGFAEDLTEGKFSFPVVHSIRSNQSNRQIINVLQKRPTTPTTKRYAISYMRDNTASFKYTRKVLKTLDKQLRAEVQRLGGNAKLDALLEQLKVPEEDESHV